jgi:putative ABC transport system ATP-binding protein
MNHILRADNLIHRVSEPALTLLEGVSLQVQAGERLAIMGRSGSGKTTLLGLLAGLDRPTSGEIWLLGEALSMQDEEGRARIRKGKVGFVFQNFQLLEGLSVLENVELPLRMAGLPLAAARRCLEDVGLSARLQQKPAQLSGGEQQRVAIARALAIQPKLLFADEPTGNLDSHTAETIIALLFDLVQQQGTTLVLVTHDEALAARCDRTIRLQQGRLL